MRTTQRFIEDETGMTMGLTVIMIVLISVMGAGLLTFVSTDLATVVETNQGQRAFEMADAGVQAAERQLASNSTAALYNGGTDDIQWSSGKSNSNCGDAGNTGICLRELNGEAETVDLVNVTIADMGSGGFKVVSTGQYEDARRRIEATFKKTVGGSGFPQMVYAEETISGHRVGIDGTLNGAGTPPGMVMYSKGSIRFDQQDTTVKNASVFSGGDIILDIQNSRYFTIKSAGSQYQIDSNECSRSQNYFNVSGTDPYGDWANSYNSTARKTSDPGMGAVGVIRDKNSSTRKPCGWGTRFFDKDTDLFQGSDPKAEFGNPPSGASRITFPFDRDLMNDTQLQKLTEDLKAVAKAQTKQYTVPSGETTDDMASNSVGNYIEIKNGKSEVNLCSPTVACGTSGQTLNWPVVPASTPASQWPVIYVKFMDNGNTNKVDWKVQPAPSTNGSSDPVARCDSARSNSPDLVRRGILIVEDGRVEFSTGVGPLDGGVITRSTDSSKKRDIGGSTPDTLCIRGPVIADGAITTQNWAGFAALPTSDFSQIPGFGGATQIALETWRERYD